MFSPVKPVFGLFQRFFFRDKALSNSIARIIGITPHNIRLYKLALTHTSLARQQSIDRHNTNERLEFLGDAILGAVVAEFLFRKYPYKDEGFLTEIRSRIVNRESLNQIAIRIGLNSLIIADFSNNATRYKSINGNALEALVGAIYLDRGYKTTRHFILEKLIKQYVDVHKITTTTVNFKSKLIEWSQGRGVPVRFEIIRQVQSGTSSEFTSEVWVDEKPVATGSGSSKKRAEQAAAEKALALLHIDQQG